MGLEVKNISKSFGDNKAVDSLSFSIDEPGIFGLIGTNGAGKTTTIRMILGMMSKDGGEVLWDRKPLDRSIVRYGYLPEERGIYPKIKVLEQLVYFGELRGMSKKNAAASAKIWLVRMGIEEYGSTTAEKLSKGNQQKVQMISAIIHDPKLIFLDEPFSGLDPINTEIFKGVIAELVEAGKYIVMSSHQMSVVEEHCRDIVLLDKGHNILSGNLRAIKASYGHTKLAVKCAHDITSQASSLGLGLIKKTAEYYEFKINGDKVANDFLRTLLNSGIYPERYEMREPSLHEIFIEKAGGVK